MKKSTLNQDIKLKHVLAINTDIRLHEKHEVEFAALGVEVIRVNTMYEAMKLLLNGNSYYVIFINENTTRDIKSMLEYMRETTTTPIFIFTSKYTIKKKLEALKLGADVYDLLSPKVEENINNVLLNRKLFDQWIERFHMHKPLPILICGDIILSPSQRTVNINGRVIKFPGKEFEVLKYLMARKSQYVDRSHIISDIWGDDDNDNDHLNALNLVIHRIRKKLKSASPDKIYIKIEKNVGYIFDEH